MAGRGTAPRLRRASASKRRAHLDARLTGGKTAMSRIYEALRKATEHGAASVPMEQVQRPQSLITQAVHGDRAGQRSPEFVSPIGLEGAPPASCYLRLDELRQRCAQPGWRLSPDYAVFSGGASCERCVQNFRHLRSPPFPLP